MRVGLGSITGLGEEGAAAVVREREANGAVRLACATSPAASTCRRTGWSGWSPPAPATSSGPRRRLVWELGLAMRSASVRGGGRQLALDLRVGGVPVLPEPDAWELLVADYPHVGLSVREHPIARIRRELDDVVSSADLYDAADRHEARAARPRDRPPAAGERQRHRLPAAGGRVRARQPDPLPRRLRALPAAGPHGAAAAGRGHAGAPRPQRQRAGGVASAARRARATARWSAAAASSQAVAALSDLRAVAPPPQHFAQGRARR